MQVSVEKVSNVERKLTILVPAEKIEDAYAKQINTVVKKANIRGFRPGKAPKSFIQKQYGESARQEVLNEVIQETLSQAITDEKLKPINTPKVELKKLKPNEPLEYTAIFEVLPEITTVNFSLEKIEQPVVDVLDADIDKVINQIQKQHAKWQSVEREAKENDRVVIDYHAIQDGKADLENKVTSYPLELGSNTMLPGFESGLIGAKINEEKHLNLQFPLDYSNADKAGKSVEFKVQVKEIFEANVPQLNEEFIKSLGIADGTEMALKKQIRESLEQERDRLVRDNVKEQIFNALIEQNEIDLPMSLVEKESQKIHDEIFQHQKHDHAHHSEKELNTFKEIAKKRVTLGILLGEYTKQHNLKPDKEQVMARIKEIASVYQQPEEIIKWLQSDKARPGIEAQVLEDQAIALLKQNIPIIEKTMSYAELKGIHI